MNSLASAFQNGLIDGLAKYSELLARAVEEPTEEEPVEEEEEDNAGD